MQKVTRCFYHRDADGFAAACIVRHYFEGIQAPCDFQAVQYGEPLPLEDMQGKNIIFVDFSPKPEEIRAILQSCDDLKILDHHKTASYIQELVPGSVFDVSKSGAVLAWEEFFPNQPVPEFILYIQDRDLWQWKLPHSREVSAAVASYPMEFGSNWTSWIWGVSLEELRVEGAAILRYQQQQISRQIGNGVEMIHLAGYWAPAVNAAVWQSEIGEALKEDHPFVVIYFDLPDKRVYSLRSKEVDVSAIARQFGGGGHRNAAGFEGQKPPVI